MPVDVILLVLRILSGIFLLVMLGGLFVFVWRDYRIAATQAEVNRRTYGKLLVLAEIDDMYAPTGDSYPLRPITSVGRSPINNIVIDDNFASSEHALVSLKDGHWWIEDRKSRNGTLLNGEPIHSPIIITDSDIISIGNTHLKITLD